VNITLLTYGSRGDVQPFIALAQALQLNGHTPLLAAPHRFASLAAEYAIPFAPLPGDPEELSIIINDSRHNLPKMISGMNAYVLSIAGPVWQAARTACQNADLIVHSFLFTTGAHALARQLGIPDVSVQLFPIFAPTRAFPIVAAPNLPTGLLSYFSHWLSTQIFWQVGSAGFKRLRAGDPQLFDLTLTWPFDRHPSRSAGAPTPLVFAFSPSLLPRPSDWTDPHIHIPGYFFTSSPTAFTPPASLVEFLAAGTPPVCITFGSMISQEARRTTEQVHAALKRFGLRAVQLTGWGGPDFTASDLLSLPAVPHEWLLPRCAAVIHHGGAGTTGAGLRAGIPNIIIPHGADQPFWGACIARAGAGPKPLNIHQLTEKKLDDALQLALQPAVRSRAAQIGAAIQSENGVLSAVQIIENLLAR